MSLLHLRLCDRQDIRRQRRLRQTGDHPLKILGSAIRQYVIVHRSNRSTNHNIPYAHFTNINEKFPYLWEFQQPMLGQRRPMRARTPIAGCRSSTPHMVIVLNNSRHPLLRRIQFVRRSLNSHFSTDTRRHSPRLLYCPST